MSRILKEPLFHFLLLGAALFAVFGWARQGERGGDDSTITVSAGRIQQMAGIFAKTWQRPPTKQELQGLIDNNSVNETSMLRVLSDRQKGPVSEVKSDRLPFATAHAITAPFIVLPEYGTRCSTVVRADKANNWTVLERRFAADGNTSGDSRYSFSVAQSEK